MNAELTTEKEEIINIPNLVTISRGLLMVGSCIETILHWPSVCTASCFAVWALWDGLDGFLARKLDQKTEFGKKLDPTVDAIAFVSWMTALIVTTPDMYEKALFITTLGTQIAYSGHLSHKWKQLPKEYQNWIGPTITAKTKTAIMMIAITILLSGKHPIQEIQTIIPNTKIHYSSRDIRAMEASIHAGGLGGVGAWIFGTLLCWIGYNRKANSILTKQPRR